MRDGARVVAWTNAESLDSLLRRFRRKVQASGHLRELRVRGRCVTRAERRKAKRERNQRRRAQREARERVR